MDHVALNVRDVDAGKRFFEQALSHVALASPNRPTVDRFYESAIAAGGRDNGPPGVREHYHEHYCSAFVLDPDGRDIEAVSQRRE